MAEMEQVEDACTQQAVCSARYRPVVQTNQGSGGSGASSVQNSTVGVYSDWSAVWRSSGAGGTLLRPCGPTRYGLLSVCSH